GIWGFKDGKAATFDRFEMLIPAADQYNVRQFELFVGDDGPSGAFRSIGVFTTQNTKLMQSPYQAFTFPPVTAKFLKVALQTDWGGGYIAAYDVRLIGTLGPERAQGLRTESALPLRGPWRESRRSRTAPDAARTRSPRGTAPLTSFTWGCSSDSKNVGRNS